MTPAEPQAGQQDVVTGRCRSAGPATLSSLIALPDYKSRPSGQLHGTEDQGGPSTSALAAAIVILSHSGARLATWSKQGATRLPRVGSQSCSKTRRRQAAR